MAISTNFPNVRPSLLLDFANAQQLDPRVTFSRSTTALYYDGKTSVLAEQNLLIQSNTFSNAAWVATSATIASGVTDPAGGTTAFSMTATAGNATLYQTLTLTATAYTESIWIQRVTGTGTINLTLDGSTLSPVTITGSWAKYTYTATPAAGARTIGIQIVTSGDAINIYGSQIENRSSATATNITTTSALTNYIPQLLTAPINQPRFDFNPTTGESLGLLIEQSSTNLLLRSEEFNNAYWRLSGATITADIGVAPNGTQTADLLIETAVNTEHRIVRDASITIGSQGTYSQSIYCKPYGRNFLNIIPQDALATPRVVIDVVNNSYQIAGAFTNGSSFISATSTPVGNGWYRVSVTWVTSTAPVSLNTYFQLSNSASNGSGYLGDGYSGMYIWGAQLEALAFPTSYVPTTSAQVTRASDNASMTGTNFSSWYNNGQGTMFVDFTISSRNDSPPYRGAYSLAVAICRLDVIKTTSGLPPNVARSIAVGRNKEAAAYSSANQTITEYINGVNTATLTPVLAINNTASSLAIGRDDAFSALSGTISKLVYYPTTLTSAQLQALTGS